MKIVRTPEEKWEVRNGDKTMVINGALSFDSYADIATIITKKGLFIWSDSTIHKEDEPEGDGYDVDVKPKKENPEMPGTPDEYEVTPPEPEPESLTSEEKKKARNRRAYLKRKERYKNDPEFREKLLSYNREYAKKKQD